MDDGSIKVTARDTRRQGIIDVAREVFMQDGYAAASMSTIAARVGGSKGTLYNYFTSKEALFTAVIQDECDLKQAAMFDTLEAEGDDVEAALRHVGHRYTRMVLSDRTLIMSRVVIAECTRFPELGRVLHEAGPKRGRACMARYVHRQMQAGRLKAADPERLVDQFCDLCLSGLYRPRLMNVTAEPSDAEVRDNVEAALTLVLAVYGPEAPPPR